MWQKLKESKLLHQLINYFGLFSSFGTLLCCALPSTIVLLGFGAALANFLGEYPQLIWLSENKELVFGVSLSMLFLSYISQKLAATQVCPVDKRDECLSTKNWSRPLFFASLGINVIGVLYAFLLPRLL